MARWGLGWGCVFGFLAVCAGAAAMRWQEGAAPWIGWGAVAVLAWGAVMSVYAFDRPAPPGAPPKVVPRTPHNSEHQRRTEK
ncbi:hypothetical protein GobsT_41800 [Gemmata obscuriglobus]|uniref:Uncharacterized protein n=1 Tax=Gemmata obscuriglobus TaxID=114 RepID=A0A2Z3H257_9BACT|nr:hypothetical protein [Gemmata obscuriglobus]AWM37797.1 hypothetical protein C1280_12845 [Gemmata obscuriglobus]QEG29384.1 hypothetical protein GobsT_41800 [Gemmata obscuriglobus]VTS08441.1 unnamed protein product [Gemmata obscuriglobus UQM 2246]